jgi:hypothetical protein
MKANQQAQDELTMEHKTTLSNLEKEYWTGRLYTLRKHHAEIVEAENTYSFTERNLLAEQMTEVIAMFQSMLNSFASAPNSLAFVTLPGSFSHCFSFPGGV